MKVVLMKGNRAVISYKVSMLKSIKFDNDNLMYIVEFNDGRKHLISAYNHYFDFVDWQAAKSII